MLIIDVYVMSRKEVHDTRGLFKRPILFLYIDIVPTLSIYIYMYQFVVEARHHYDYSLKHPRCIRRIP